MNNYKFLSIFIYLFPPIFVYTFYLGGYPTFALCLMIFYYGLLTYWCCAKDELIKAQRELIALYERKINHERNNS